MDCNQTWSEITRYKIEEDKVYVDGKLYANLISMDEESGVFEASLISDNKFLNGNKVTGIIVTAAAINQYLKS